MQNENKIPADLFENRAEDDALNLKGDDGKMQMGAAREGDRMVPLAALQKEREKSRALKRESDETGKIIENILKRAGVSSLAQLEDVMRAASQEGYVENRLKEKEAAEKMLSQQAELEELRQLKRHTEAEEEKRRLKENPLYSDIDEVYPAVAEYAEGKGLSLKEAYNALFGEQRAEKIRHEAREAALAEARQKMDKKIPALSSFGNMDSGERGGAALSGEELAWAGMAGISPEDYAKYKKK